MARVTVNVTAEHIARGDHCGRSCPVALALRDATGRLWQVDYAMLLPLTPDGETPDEGPRQPREVLDFVAAFDGREEVAPFSFALDLPE